MSIEKHQSRRIPEENRLPLKIEEQEHIAESGESNVWKTAVHGNEGQKSIVLKQNRRTEFASDAEMQESKKFYEFLKAFPGFGKFVPDTLYFKARMTTGDTPQAFAVQRFLDGRTIDQLSDDELHKDPVVVEQLIEFAKEAVKILQDTRREKSLKPDFGTAGTATDEAQRYGNTFGNSRYSTNILITGTPDERGQRVFFIDTGVNADERTSKSRQVVERQVMGRMREFNFNRWIKKLENRRDSVK